MGEKRNKAKFFDAELKIKLPQYQLDYIKKRAKEDNMTVSAWVRKVLLETSKWEKF